MSLHVETLPARSENAEVKVNANKLQLLIIRTSDYNEGHKVLRSQTG